MIDADNKTLLKKLKISHILNMAKEAPCFHPEDFEYLHIKASDVEGFDIGRYLRQTSDYIQKGVSKGTGVFVHCVYGISRGSTAVIAYYMKSKGMSLMQAKRKVERARPHIYPNFGFIRCLKGWARELDAMRKRKGKGGMARNFSNAKSYFEVDYLPRNGIGGKSSKMRKRTAKKKKQRDGRGSLESKEDTFKESKTMVSQK